MGVFHAISGDTYFNAALGTGAVAIQSLGGMGNTADGGIGGGSYQATHARITCAHATQYAAALVADSGTVVLGSGTYSVLIPALGSVVVPLSRTRRISIIASAANTIVSVEFGIYRY